MGHSLAQNTMKKHNNTKEQRTLFLDMTVPGKLSFSWDNVRYTLLRDSPYTDPGWVKLGEARVSCAAYEIPVGPGGSIRVPKKGSAGADLAKRLNEWIGASAVADDQSWGPQRGGPSAAQMESLRDALVELFSDRLNAEHNQLRDRDAVLQNAFGHPSDHVMAARTQIPVNVLRVIKRSTKGNRTQRKKQRAVALRSHTVWTMLHLMQKYSVSVEDALKLKKTT